jgi:hypothetical protein
MSIIAEIIDTLENKFENFLSKWKFRTNNQDLKRINKTTIIIKTQSNEIEKKPIQYEQANSLLGSDDNKKRYKA